MELGTDEAYYWFYSRHIKLNYFDHPPMIAFLIRLFTGNLILESHEGFIRLGSVTACAISSWFIYKTCRLLDSERAGLFGVCLYNTSFFAAVTAGIFIMPDAPLMVFYTLCLLITARISKDDNNWKNWILFGVASGFSIMSKIYGVLPWIGLGVFILVKKQGWLRKKQLYVAIAIALVITIPILLWNLKYHFVTHDFQADRLSLNKDSINIISFFREFFNQLLFNNPFNVIITASALVWFVRNKLVRSEALIIYNFIALPFAILLFIIALQRDTTLPHWSGPAYIALIPLAAIYLASSKKLIPTMLKASVAGSIVFLITWQGLIQFYSGTLGDQGVVDGKKGALSKGQNFLEVLGGFTEMQLVAEPLNSWSEAEKQFIAVYRNDISTGRMRENSPVICYKWWGAQIEYYFCHKNNIYLVGLGKLGNLGEILWANTNRKDRVNMNTAYCIVPSDMRYNVASRYSQYYNSINAAEEITVNRRFRPPLRFYIYRLSGWKTQIPFIK